ncbi:MAG: hypothetical protein U0984_02885 [Prosthecobacter sp.]|nr:hypothetical protein [Prosthecobacter sp.]
MIDPFSLSTAHTAISVIAVLAGLISFIWHKEITPRSAWGRIYVLATIISVLTGIGIYNHGGFGPPHILGIVTLVVLRIGTAAGQRQFGAASPYLEAVAFSATFFFHMIPAIIEGATRLPLGKPLVASREDPVLLTAIGVCFGLFFIGVILQIIRLRRQHAKPGLKLQSLTVPRI